jgi:uncharacterized protein
VKRFKNILLLLTLVVNVAAQSRAVYIKAFVKKDEIILRWAPANKKVFDLAVSNGYKIIRTDDVGNKLVLHEAFKPYQKEDSAWYHLLARNENAIFAVNVIYQNKPKAGLPLKEQQNNEMMAYNMFLMSCNFDAEVARASALLFRDGNVDPARKYIYKIEVNGLSPAMKLIPGTLSVRAGELSKNPSISNLNGIFKNKSVRLKWKAADLISDYCGYNIERSRDSINYVKLNKAPVILISSQFEKNKQFIYYLDTFPTTKEKYYYRIRGINHFGELSEGSNVVAGIGYEPLSSYPLIDSIKVINNLKVYIHFQMENKKENEIPKEYIVMRSKKDKGPYRKLFGSAIPSEYVDERPESANYYKVGAITYGGDTLYSFSYLALISDTIPPSPPKNLKATVDMKGNVTLTWDKNTETDVRGYKILKANALHEEFVQINQEFVKEPKFKDKLNLKTLTKNIYYCVVATDKRYNNSDKCPPIEVKRPDTISPVKPILTNLEVKENGIKVNWINSSSEDVKYYVLYRSTELQGKDTKIKDWQAKDSLRSLMDTTVIAGVGYKYRLLVSDQDDNISISNNPYVKYETGYRKKLTDIKFTVDRTQKTVHLKWNYNEKDIEKYILYRAKKGNVLTIVKTLPGKTPEFIDNTLNIGNIYEYRIKPVFVNGAEGIISDPVWVEY